MKNNDLRETLKKLWEDRDRVLSTERHVTIQTGLQTGSGGYRLFRAFSIIKMLEEFEEDEQFKEKVLKLLRSKDPVLQEMGIRLYDNKYLIWQKVKVEQKQ